MKHANKILGFLVAFAIGTAFAQTVVRDDWDFIGDVTFRGDATAETGFTSQGQFLAADGAVDGPSYSRDDEDTGMYFSGSGQMNWASSGTRVGVLSAGGWKAVDGTVAAPGFNFINDADSGLYSTAEDCLGMAQGGGDLGQWCVDVQTLSAAEVQSLNGTPVALVAALADHAFIPVDARFMLDWESAAYDDDAAGEDFQIVGATSGTVWMTCDNATCLDVDATADAFGYARSNVFGSDLGIALQSEALNIQIASGEIFSAAGDSPIIVVMTYKIAELVLN